MSNDAAPKLGRRSVRTHRARQRRSRHKPGGEPGSEVLLALPFGSRSRLLQDELLKGQIGDRPAEALVLGLQGLQPLDLIALQATVIRGQATFLRVMGRKARRTWAPFYPRGLCWAVGIVRNRKVYAADVRPVPPPVRSRPSSDCCLPASSHSSCATIAEGASSCPPTSKCPGGAKSKSAIHDAPVGGRSFLHPSRAVLRLRRAVTFA